MSLHPVVQAMFIEALELPPDAPERVERALSIKNLGHFIPAVELLEAISPQVEFYTRFKALIATGECYIVLGQLDRALAPMA